MRLLCAVKDIWIFLKSRVTRFESPLKPWVTPKIVAHFVSLLFVKSVTQNLLWLNETSHMFNVMSQYAQPFWGRKRNKNSVMELSPVFSCCRLERPEHCTTLGMCSMRRANSSYGAAPRNRGTCPRMSETHCKGPQAFMSKWCGSIAVFNRKSESSQGSSSGFVLLFLLSCRFILCCKKYFIYLMSIYRMDK